MNPETLHASIEALYERPTPKRPAKHKFTAEAKAALLQALQQHSWTTAREAYGWVWNELGLRVSYLTLWRFLNAQGLFTGDTLRSRKLKTSP